jgi:hypothetical protein
MTFPRIANRKRNEECWEMTFWMICRAECPWMKEQGRGKWEKRDCLSWTRDGRGLFLVNTKRKRNTKRKFLIISEISRKKMIFQRLETNEKQDEMMSFLNTQRKKRIWFSWARREKTWLNLSFRSWLYQKRESDATSCREQCLRVVNWPVRRWICRCMSDKWWSIYATENSSIYSSPPKSLEKGRSPQSSSVLTRSGQGPVVPWQLPLSKRVVEDSAYG